MSDKRVSYLRITVKEAQIIADWFKFQEQCHPESGKTSITKDDVDLLKNIQNCLKKVRKDPDRFVAIRLAPRYCETALGWFKNIPECVAGKTDANIHASLGLFLEEYYSE